MESQQGEVSDAHRVITQINKKSRPTQHYYMGLKYDKDLNLKKILYVVQSLKVLEMKEEVKP